MAGRIEPVVKYLLMLFMLMAVLPNRFEKRKTVLAVLLYGTAVMAGVYQLTQMDAFRQVSYYLYLLLVFMTGLVWSLLFQKGRPGQAVPYLLFYLDCIIYSRVLADALVKAFAMAGGAWTATGLAALFLLLTNCFIIRYPLGDSPEIVKGQFGIVITAPLILFFSFELWRRYANQSALTLPVVSLVYYFLSMLVYYLVHLSICEYDNLIRSGIIAKKYEMEIDEMKNNEKLMQDFYRTRHEFRNVCLQMQVMLEGGEYEQLQAFLKKYTGEKLNYNNRISSGNSFVDTVLSDRIREARANDIPVVAKLSLNQELPLNEDELCTVLLNLMDNAIEASRKTPSPEIQIDMNAVRGFLQITVRNRTGTDVLAENPKLKTSKQDKKAHGIGIPLLREIAAKHDGSLEFRMENGYFVAEMTI